MGSTRSKDGTTLVYDSYGSGPVLIYITGAICFRKFMPVVKDAKVFGQSFTTYIYDRRGRGDSGDTLPYSIEKEIEDLEAVIDAAGGKAVVYGHSSGAAIALEAALRIPQKISKVILFDAPYVHDDPNKREYAALAEQVKASIQQQKNAKALRQFVIGIGMPKIFAYLLPLMPGWKTMKALAPTLEYDMILTKDLPPLDRAAKIQIPIQIIYGEKSPESLRSVAQQLKSAISNAQLHELARQDHMAKPELLLPLFHSFARA